MVRNVWLGLAFAMAIFVVYNILPFPVRCSPAGCVADIAKRWNAISFAAQVTRFVLCWAGAVVVFQWIAPSIMAYRARARARMWGHPEPE